MSAKVNPSLRVVSCCLGLAGLLVPDALGAIPWRERQALIALWNATNGPVWGPSWVGPPGTECTWGGIDCNNERTSVVQIYLGQVGLAGSIPPEFGNLRNLTWLFLGQNGITSVPSEMGNLSGLTYLDLNSNKLTSLPPEMGRLNVWNLDVGRNQLTSIPRELSYLPRLQELVLGGNQIQSVPPEMGNIAGLRALDLSSNRLASIPPELGRLANLRRLWLGGNQIASVPVELSNLDRLEELQLSGNPIASIPSWLGRLISLKRLELSRLRATGIPPELGNLGSLQHLDLSGNQLASVPPELGNLPSLQRLDLSVNQLASVPPELGNLRSLQELWLGGNLLTSIPRELGGLGNLRYLELGENQLTTLPREIGGLRSLERLGLWWNQLAAIPLELFDLTKLEALDLAYNRIGGPLPSEIGALSSLWYLAITGNRFVGELPTSLMNLNWLYADLGYNGLHTSNLALRTFLAQHAYDWEWTQTVAPSMVTVVSSTDTSLTLGWRPIPYVWDDGGYRVYVSDSFVGPYRLHETTKSKSASALTVTGLDPATTYFFAVQTVTYPGAGNLNLVASEPSPVASGTTGSPSCPRSFIRLLPADLPPATLGVPYSQQITAWGGASPYMLAVTAGSLPPGMTGLIEGTPTQAGAFKFTVTARDAEGCTGRQSYLMVVADPGVSYVAGEGPASTNTSRVRLYRKDGTPTPVDFQAYAAGQWGTLVAAGGIDGAGDWEIVTGAGPSPAYGPHARAFFRDGNPVAKVSFYAYSTQGYGVNVAAADLDGDGIHEILTGPGPGALFGPHVRGWDYDGQVLSSIQKVSFFAYTTLAFGANGGAGELDRDAFEEILTGPGPGSMFSPQVRGFNYDASTVAPIAGINFDAYARLRHGVHVAGGDTDLDGAAEIATAPGAGATNPSWVRGFDVDPVAPMEGFEVYPFSTLYGGRLALGDVSQDGGSDLVVGGGSDPSADSTVKTLRFDGFLLSNAGTTFQPFPTAGYGYGVNIAVGSLGW